jgi:transposase
MTRAESSGPIRWRITGRMKRAGAIVASLIEGCKLVDVEPNAYLADVMTRIINGHLNSLLDELLPWAYPTPPAINLV